MKKDVKKIILSFDENNNLIGLIVISFIGIKKYGYDNTNEDELMDIYSSFAGILRKQYQLELTELSDQDAIDKLYKMRKIEITKDNLITNITIRDEDTPNETIIVNKLFGREVIKLRDFDNKKEYLNIKEDRIRKICLDLDMEFIELERLKVYKKEYKDNILKIEKENHLSNLVIRNKGLISSILISGLAITGISLGISHFKKTEDDSVKVKEQIELVTPLEQNTLNNTFNSITSSVTPTNTPIIPTISPTIEPTNTPKPTMKITGISFKNRLLHNINPSSDKVLALVIENDTLYLKDNVTNKKISVLNNIRRIQLNNISVGDKSIKKSLTLIYYENFLTNLSKESKSFVKYFSTIGNEMILGTFQNVDIRKYAKLNASSFVSLIMDNQPLVALIDGTEQEIYYKDLSLDVKNLILDIVWNNNLILDDEITYKSNNYSKFLIHYQVLKKMYLENNIKKYINSDLVENEKNKEKLDVLKNWKNKLEEFDLMYEEYILNNSDIKEEIETTFSIHYDTYEELDQISQKEDILNSYQTSSSPFTSRFSQGKSGYGNVKFEGSTIRKSGCGICAFASGVSCGLSLEYGENVTINPSVVLEKLKNISTKHYYRTSNGLAWDTYSSVISRDLTEAFSNISVIELTARTPTFDKTQLSMITKNYPVVVSLNGRGHFVCVTKSSSDEKFYVADSDRGYSNPISINTYIVRSDGKKKGLISGKKAWIIIPNKNIKIKNNQLYVDNLDLTMIPAIGSFQTKGKSYRVEIDYTNNSIVVPVDFLEKDANGIKK
ncbi:MAG: hypothetical protein IJ068_00085 [Bacilli bacterium]|nr:hypothetical protein [Bacilli bacterium]